MNTAAIEKRRHLRLPVDVMCRLIIDNEEYSGRINNISCSGAYLATINPTLPASRLSKHGEVSLNIDDENWVSAKCEIVYLDNQTNRPYSQTAGLELSW